MTTKKLPVTRNGRGRPQSFDRQQALCAATRLFWDRGYDGTRFDDLIAAMGIGASSFYNAFGSKEALYHEVLETYVNAGGTWFSTALGRDADTRSVFQDLTETAALEFSREDQPPGCLISAAATQCAPAQDQLRRLLSHHRTQSEAAMAARLRQGVTQGDLPPGTDVTALASFFGALLRGMAVQARDGASREKLLEIAHIGMRAWPGA